VTSPNEPGSSRSGDGQGGRNGTPDQSGAHRSAAGAGTGRLTDSGDVPPWQRAAGRPRPGGQRAATESTTRQAGAPDVEARVNRFISGTAAPKAASGMSAASATVPAEDSDARSDGRQNEAYASELPDLSGPLPRQSPPKNAGAGVSRAGSSEGRVQLSSRRARGPVRASMQVRRIDPWSTLKVSLILSVALFFVWMIAVAFLYLVLGGMGVWSKLNSNVGDLLTNTNSSGELVSSGTIFGGAVLIGLVNIVLLTAMATIGAFIYNLTTDLIGGIEVTLADRD
jgi:Transmembrane domain of unknown function (DUF3566)